MTAGPSEGRSLLRSLAAHLRGRPGAQALGFFGHREPPVSFGELEEKSAAVAGWLSRRGVGQGDRVLWVADVGSASIAASLGVLRLGAVLVPASPGWTERELRHVVGQVTPVAALADGAGRGLLRSATEGGGRQPLQVEAAAVAAAGPPAEGLDRAVPGAPALIVFTSGTTGAPKGAVLTHHNLAAGAAALRQAWAIEADDRLSLSLPLFHVHGLVAGLLTTLEAGASVLLHPRFDQAAVLADVEEHRATMFFGVPTMYRRLLRAPGASALGRLRLCVSGSAPLPAELWRAVAEACSVEVLERYGMTETLLTVSNPYRGERRPGTVGLPLPGVETRLEPTEGAGDEGVGELWVRAPTVFAGYFGHSEATAAAFCGEWFRTGDIGMLDEAGYLVLLSRRSEVIVSGGFNVYPAEVEGVLLTHPSVSEAAVVGAPSEEWGEEVVAFVVADELDEASLLGFCADHLAPYKRPRRVQVVDGLPRNTMGKLDRRALLEGS